MDLIAYGQICPQLAIGRSAAFRAASRRGGRLLAVFTEGDDLGPLDRVKASEACEIGGLGWGDRRALEDSMRTLKGLRCPVGCDVGRSRLSTFRSTFW